MTRSLELNVMSQEVENALHRNKITIAACSAS